MATRPHRPSPVRSLGLALAALGLLVMGGCGKDADSRSAPDATALTITVVADEDAEPRAYELECDPTGGDHPQPAEACAALDKAGAKVFEPVPKDQACTMMYGGPQTATVTGSYKGHEVDATFNRTNGCEIDRWEQLGTTFFDVPLQ